MIQIITYRTVLDGKDGSVVKEALDTKIDRLLKIRKSLLGHEVRISEQSVWLSLRITGMDRWKVAGEARKIMSFLLASQRLPIPGGPEAVETPPNRRHQTAEQGRPPRRR